MSKLLEYYEHLHAHPELSGKEFQTAEFLLDTLAGMGYGPERIGETFGYVKRNFWRKEVHQRTILFEIYSWQRS